MDLLLGGDGNDGQTLTADGARDYANCGNGTDTFSLGEGIDGANRNCEIRAS